jgi:hypothetical protein
MLQIHPLFLDWRIFDFLKLLYFVVNGVLLQMTAITTFSKDVLYFISSKGKEGGSWDFYFLKRFSIKQSLILDLQTQ